MADEREWAFFFSDIEGSTRLLLLLGEAYDACLATHRALVRDAMARYGGQEQGTEGDSFMVAFRDAVSATRAAVDAQRALAEHQWPPGADLRVRMGIHVGPARHDPALGFRGVTVHAAARVMASGHGGQIVVTQAVVDAVAPEGIRTMPLGTYRLKDLPLPLPLHQVVMGAGDDQTRFPPLRGAALNRRSPWRHFATPLRGREELMARLLEALEDVGLVTLTGAPGVGKTRLALEALSAVDPTADRSYFVDLATVGDPDGVPTQVAEALDVRDVVSIVPAIAGRLSERRSILVLDNCEHLVTPTAELVESLFDLCSDLTVVVTTREPLAISDERILAVPPLPVATEGASAAVRVFLDRAGALGAPVPESSLPDVVAICRRLEGIPLAVELAAALTPVLTPPEIAQRLASRFDLLRGGERRSTDRHRTLEAAVAWGYDLLDEEERRLLRCVGVCVGWFDLPTAEALTGASGGVVIAHLHRLVRTSWLTRGSEGATSRFRLLETLRVFAEERARQAGELEDLRRRHAAHFFERARRVADRYDTIDVVSIRTEVDPFLDDLLAAFSWSIDRRELVADAVGTYVSLARYWQIRGDWAENARLVDELLACTEATDDLPAAARSDFLSTAGFWVGQSGDDQRSRALFDRAIETAHSAGDARAIARSTRLLAQHLRTSEPMTALRYLDECLAVGGSDRQLRSLLTMALYDRAIALSTTRGVVEALGAAREAVGRATAVGDQVSEMFGRSILGAFFDLAGDESNALREFEACRQLVDRTEHAMAQVFFHLRYIQIAEPERYLSAATEAISNARRMGSRVALVDAYRVAAGAEIVAGDPATAEAHLHEADALGGVGQGGGSRSIPVLRAALAMARGEVDLARRSLAEVLEETTRTSSRAVACGELWLADAWGLIQGRDASLAVAETLTDAIPVFGIDRLQSGFARRPRPPYSPAPFDSLDLDRFDAAVSATIQSLRSDG